MNTWIIEYKLKKILERTKTSLSDVLLRAFDDRVEVYKDEILIGVVR